MHTSAKGSSGSGYSFTSSSRKFDGPKEERGRIVLLREKREVFMFSFSFACARVMGYEHARVDLLGYAL